MPSNTKFEYTLNMKSIFQGKLSELKSYYCREDFELALSDVDHAAKDSRKFFMRSLEHVCDARGIRAQELLLDRTILEQVPLREQMQEELLRSFYEMYVNAPGTSDFMERIVRRLAPEYQADTVRTAILKKFIAGGGEHFKRFHTKQVLDWVEKRLSKEEQELLIYCTSSERKEFLISRLDDSIFTYEPVEFTVADIFLLIADRMEKYQEDASLEFENVELTFETQELLDGLLGKYNLNKEKLSDSDKVKRVAEAVIQGIIPKSELIGHEEIVISVENDFRTQLKTIRRISKTGKAGTAADLYKQAKKDAVKARKNAAKKNNLDYELLDMCRDLAKGNFRVNGKTKVYLYYFAFMFEMTVPMEGRESDPEKDMVKNLFQDFYNDNLLRLLAGDYVDPKTVSALEKEPTGEGINYKNFVEAIYLYFLCHDELAMSPGEKIDAAEEIIEECVKRAKKSKKSEKLYDHVHTKVYRDTHMNELLNKEIGEIADYILVNYRITCPDNIGSSRIMAASEENTASDLIEEIMDDLDTDYPDIELFGSYEKEILKKEAKDDEIFMSARVFDWKIKSLLEDRYFEDADFMKVVSALDDRVRIKNGRFHKAERERLLMLLHVLSLHSGESNPMSVYKIQSRMEEKGVVSVGAQMKNAINTLMDLGYDIQRRKDNYFLGERTYDDCAMNDLLKLVSGRYYTVEERSELMLAELLVRRLRFEKRITRSELIALHFYYYIALLNETDGLDTFPDVFEDYSETINPILEEARYQPLSEKNIFDMYVVTALYFYLVENNGYM